MKSAKTISRRRMLRGLGVSMALPKLEIMSALTATAALGATQTASASSSKPGQSSAAPMRFISIFQPNGIYPKAWDVTGEGKNYEISPTLKPLEPLRNDVNILSGLDNYNILAGVNGNHVSLTSAFLTGHGVKNRRAAISLDQKIAKHIGGNTAFQSIVLGTEPPRQGMTGGNPISMAGTVSWNSPTTRINPEINPRVVFDRLFRNNSSPEAKHQASLQKSVVDIVLEDAKGLRRQASTLDKHKLDEYLDSIRAVELQIERTINPVEPDWIPPHGPTDADFVAPAPGIPRDRALHLRLMTDIMILALWTDTTRVATLMNAHGFSRQNCSFIDGVTDNHHGMSHHKELPKSVANYTLTSTWYVAQFAYLLNRLKSIDEEGSSLLDNSIVLFGSGMKDGNGHIGNNLPILLAGNGQGQIKTGRHIRVDSQPLANLHFTIAQKFGIEDPDFNGVGTRTLSELG